MYADKETISESVRPLVRRRRDEDQAESRSTRQPVEVAEERVATFATNIDTTRVTEQNVDLHSPQGTSVPILTPPAVPNLAPPTVL